MTDIDTETLEAKVQKYTDQVERTRDTGEGTYLLASAAEHAALYRTLLGEFENIEYWYRLAADHHLRRARFDPNNVDDPSTVRSLPDSLKSALMMAVLSGDQNFREAVAEEVADTEQAYPDIVTPAGNVETIAMDSARYQHLMLLAALVKNDTAAVQSHFEYLSDELSQTGEPDLREKEFAGVSTAAEGFLCEDDAHLADGLSKILDIHRQRIEAELHASDHQAICLEATVLLSLAYERGLEPTVDVEYIPTKLLERLE